MKKNFLIFLLIYSSSFAQTSGEISTNNNRASKSLYNKNKIEHWEDCFWCNETVERCYKNHTKSGMYTEYYKNGQIKWQGKCLDDGTPDSIWTYYSEDGKRYWEGDYNGKYYEFSETGDTILMGAYRDGYREGEWITLGNDKNILKRGYYKKGEPAGIWQEYRTNYQKLPIYKSVEFNYNTNKMTTYKENGDTLKYEEINSYDADISLNQNEPYFINVDFAGGIQYINFTNLNNFYIQTGYKGLNTPICFGGIAFSQSEEVFYQSYKFNYFPFKSNYLNDSIKVGISGYNFSGNWGGDLIKNPIVDIVPSIGIGFESFKLKVTKTRNQDSTGFGFDEPSYKVYKNPAPILNGIMNIRLNLGLFTINAAGGYVLDCARTRWKYSGIYLNNSPRTSASGWIVSLSVGFHIDEN